MLRKIMFAFTAAVAASSASAAFAYETPENKISDRYPFLEQVYIAQGRGHKAYAQASMGDVTYKQAWRICKDTLDRERIPGTATSVTPRYLRGGACMAKFGYRL